jgi:hypothetical protein
MGVRILASKVPQTSNSVSTNLERSSSWNFLEHAIALTTAKLSEDQPLAANFLAICHRNAWLLPFQRQYIDFKSHEFANKLPE